jgi:hypothetical protein
VTVARPPFREVKLTSPRQENATVAYLQDLLVRRASKYARGLTVTGEFDRRTGDELEAFLYRMGHPNPVPAIGPEGLVALWRWDQLGAKLPDDWATRRVKRMAVPFSVAKGWTELSWRLAHPAAFPVEYDPAKGLAVSRQWAADRLREDPAGSNYVPALSRIGFDLGCSATFAGMRYAWCAYAFFLAHLVAGSVTAKAGLLEGKFWPLFTPTLQELANRGAFGMAAVTLDQAKPGYGVLFDFDGGQVDHIGMYVSHDATTVTTSDGNTSAAGSQSNGGACLIRTRPRSTVRTVFSVR